VAIPWLVLVTTGSPTRMGLVAAAELVPYVVATALGGPLIDRVGVRRTAISVDAASAATTAAIVVFSDLGLTTLLLLVALLGGLRGFGDNAKKVLVPPAAQAAGAAMVRVTAIFDGMSRLAMMVGVSVAGVLIAWQDAPTTIAVTALSFAVSAVLVSWVTRPTDGDTDRPAREPYLRAMTVAVAHLRQDRITFNVVAMLFAINVFNQASGVVFIPLWADEVLGSPVAFGAILGTTGAGLVIGNVVFTVLATRVPRYATLTLGFLIGGAPRFAVLGLSDDLTTVLVVSFVAGCALSSVNPIIGVLMFDRTPEALRARVFGLGSAVAFAGLPVGGLLGGWAVAVLDLRPALLLTAALYLAAALVPVVGYRTWRQLDPAEPEP